MTDNCSLFLLRRAYLSWPADELTSTPKVSCILRQIFSNSIFAKMMKQYDGSAVAQFFRLYNMLTVARCSEARLLTRLT